MNASQGFAAINRFIPEPVQFGETIITQKSLYTALFVIGLPILWFAGQYLFHSLVLVRYADGLRDTTAPISTFFWLVGSSSVVILGHAAMLEPGVESEYGGVQTV